MNELEIRDELNELRGWGNICEYASRGCEQAKRDSVFFSDFCSQNGYGCTINHLNKNKELNSLYQDGKTAES